MVKIILHSHSYSDSYGPNPSENSVQQVCPISAPPSNSLMIKACRVILLQNIGYSTEFP